MDGQHAAGTDEMPPVPLRTRHGFVKRHDWRKTPVRRRLLAISAVYDGMSRAAANAVHWVHRFNVDAPAGLTDRKAPAAVPGLTGDQEAELAALVEAACVTVPRP